MCDYNAPNDNNWVNMIPIGKQAVWFSDTPTMVVMDPETMNCTGYKTWADDATVLGKAQPKWLRMGHMAAGGSAHPLPRPGTKSVVEIIASAPALLGNHYVDIYTFDATVEGLQNR